MQKISSNTDLEAEWWMKYMNEDNDVTNLQQSKNIKTNKNLKNKENTSDENDTTNSNIMTISDFKNKERMLLEVLNDFYNKCTPDEIKMIIEIIESNHEISLRFLDWFVTRYCKLYKLSIKISNRYIKEEEINVIISYYAQLDSHKKKRFDPFRRKRKFMYGFGKHNTYILTTLGQLNFFKWALSHDIITYAKNNFDNINEKMSHVNSYFEKHIIDTNSLTLTTTEENNCSENNCSENQTNLETTESDKATIIINTKKPKKINRSNKSNKVNKSNKKNETDKLEKLDKSNVSKECNTYEDNSMSKLSQTDINILMDANNIKKNIKPSKKFNDLKNSQTSTKYPQVKRNICIEF